MHAAFAADAMQSVIQISERTASLPPARPGRLERTIEPASRLVAAATGALGSNDLGDAAALGAREENVIAVVPATPIPEVFDGAIGFAAVPRIALDPQLFSGLRMSGRQAGRQHVAGDPRHALDLGREVALVGHADDAAAEPERVEQLCSVGHQADDPHRSEDMAELLDDGTIEERLRDVVTGIDARLHDHPGIAAVMLERMRSTDRRLMNGIIETAAPVQRAEAHRNGNQ